jgi:hypothetical protein
MDDEPLRLNMADRVELAAREVLAGLDRVGWPISMNAAVERLRAALNRVAAPGVADLCVCPFPRVACPDCRLSCAACASASGSR